LKGNSTINCPFLSILIDHPASTRRQYLTELFAQIDVFCTVNPAFFLDLKIHPARHLSPKSQIPFRIVPENGSAVPVSIHQPKLTSLKIDPELPSERILPQFPLIKKDLTLAL
jgi:hypothetical protein